MTELNEYSQEKLAAEAAEAKRVKVKSAKAKDNKAKTLLEAVVEVRSVKSNFVSTLVFRYSTTFLTVNYASFKLVELSPKHYRKLWRK